MNLFTPVHLKRPGDPLRPSPEPMYYLLAGNGLFVCRNHEFYTSAVPARQWPGELAEHASFLEPRFPRIPRRDVERILGFFHAIACRQHSEAAVLLVFDRATRAVEIVVPEQQANATRVTYEVPALAPGRILFGDVHSHVDGAAYASHVDAEDELSRPGLHIVVGRVRRAEPEIYVAAVIDGVRIELVPADAMEDYGARAAEVPGEWLERVRPLPARSWSGSWGGCVGSVGSAGPGTPAPATDRGPFVLRPAPGGPERPADAGGGGHG